METREEEKKIFSLSLPFFIFIFISYHDNSVKIKAVEWSIPYAFELVFCSDSCPI